MKQLEERPSRKRWLGRMMNCKDFSKRFRNLRKKSDNSPLRPSKKSTKKMLVGSKRNKMKSPDKTNWELRDKKPQRLVDKDKKFRRKKSATTKNLSPKKSNTCLSLSRRPMKKERNWTHFNWSTMTWRRSGSGRELILKKRITSDAIALTKKRPTSSATDSSTSKSTKFTELRPSRSTSSRPNRKQTGNSDMNTISSIAHTLQARMSMPQWSMWLKTQMIPSMKLKTSVTSCLRSPTTSLTSTAKRYSCPNQFLSNAESTIRLISRSNLFALNTESISLSCQSRLTSISLDPRESDANSSRAC